MGRDNEEANEESVEDMLQAVPETEWDETIEEEEDVLVQVAEDESDVTHVLDESNSLTPVESLSA